MLVKPEQSNKAEVYQQLQHCVNEIEHFSDVD